MRSDLTQYGVEEARTPEDVDQLLGPKSGTVLMVVNSVCGCAARIFLILTAIAAVWMLGEHTPVYQFVFSRLPVALRGSLYAEYALMAFCLFAGITAAMVLDRLPARVPEAVLWGIALFTCYDLIRHGSHKIGRASC